VAIGCSMAGKARGHLLAYSGSESNGREHREQWEGAQRAMGGAHREQWEGAHRAMGGSTESNGREHREQWEEAHRAMGGSTESNGRSTQRAVGGSTENSGRSTQRAMERLWIQLTFPLHSVWSLLMG
jgi:hypothetical protein